MSEFQSGKEKDIFMVIYFFREIKFNQKTPQTHIIW